MTTTKFSNARELWDNRFRQLQEADLDRSMHCAQTPVGPNVVYPEGEMAVFCSNDYLGLAAHPALREALCRGASRWGVGAGASRLVSGNTDAHEAVERETAALVEKAAAVLFVSGYQANVGALSCLVGEGDVIFSDELVHASLIDGARLSRAETVIYPHRDTARLGELLDAHSSHGIRLIVTDTVFSMDGDTADIAALVETARARGAALYLDEAHAMGVLGPRGAGLAASVGLASEIDVIVGTYSKAYGAAGAFVATSSGAASLLKSRARGLLFSTGQPPALSEAIRVSLALVGSGDDLREALHSNIDTFLENARALDLPILPSSTAIQPIMTFGNARTMAVSAHLRSSGFFVQGIRPPTIPAGAARLRVTLSAAHAPDDIRRLTRAIRAALDAVPE